MERRNGKNGRVKNGCKDRKRPGRKFRKWLEKRRKEAGNGKEKEK